jgi:hypothetical protein
MVPVTATFFATPAAFRAWLDTHHRDAAELLVELHRKGSGKASMTYGIRFTPRRPGSIWSFSAEEKRAR